MFEMFSTAWQAYGYDVEANFGKYKYWSLGQIQEWAVDSFVQEEPKTSERTLGGMISIGKQDLERLE